MPEITVFGAYLVAALLLAGSARTRASRKLGGLASLIAVAPVALHGWLLWQTVASSDTAHLGLGLSNSVSLSGWLLAVLAVPFAFQAPFRGLVALFLAGAGITALFTGDPGPAAGPSGDQPLWQFISHAVMATLAYSLLAGAAILAVISTLKDRRVRHAGDTGWTAMLPSLEALERKMFAAISIGFALLSLAIFSGLVFVRDLLEQHLTHKLVLTTVAWGVFGVLLFGRWKFGWRGRKAVRLTLTGFLVLALAYFGSRIVLEIILGRHWG